MLAPGDAEAIRKAALRALREELAVAETHAFHSMGGELVAAIKRQIEYTKKMVFVEIGPDGRPTLT